MSEMKTRRANVTVGVGLRCSVRSSGEPQCVGGNGFEVAGSDLSVKTLEWEV